MHPAKLQLLVDAVHLAQAAYHVEWCAGGEPYTRWELYEDSKSGARVFVANRGAAVDVAFTGTQWWDLRDWMTNFNAWAGLSDLFEGAVHRGYRDAYESARPFIRQQLAAIEQEHGELSIRVAGHSNGGALAVFCTQELRQRYERVYGAGFGTPAILSAKAQRSMLGQFYNVIAAGDLVPVLSRKKWYPAGRRVYVDKNSRVFEYTGSIMEQLDWCLHSNRGMFTFKPHFAQHYVDLLSCAQ